MTMFLASAALYALYLFERSPGDRLTVGTVGEALGFVPFLAFPVVGALIASRRPQNPIGWICLADGLFWSLLGLTDYYSRYGMAQPGSIPFSVAITASLGQWLWLPPVGLLGIYMILLFPDGKLPSRRWRPLAWLSGTVIVFGGVGFAIDPGPLPGLGGVRNPFGVEGAPWGAIVGPVVFALLPLCILASVLSLVLRFRGSRGEERQQIKWIAFAASLVGLLFLSVIVTSLIPSLGYLERVLQTVVALSYAGVPIAVGLAVLRYRLYDIDLLINRTLVYGPLTAMLVLVYVGIVASLQYALRVLTGQESTLAVVASTLAIAALFNPLRRRVQASVDRRFYRRKYDAAKTLAAFNTRLREETDLEALSEDLVEVASATVQPQHVSLWLRPDLGPEARSAAIEQFGHDE
jgi:predicted component of type VI protein secretion system